MPLPPVTGNIDRGIISQVAERLTAAGHPVRVEDISQRISLSQLGLQESDIREISVEQDTYDKSWFRVKLGLGKREMLPKEAGASRSRLTAVDVSGNRYIPAILIFHEPGSERHTQLHIPRPDERSWQRRWTEITLLMFLPPSCGHDGMGWLRFWLVWGVTISTMIAVFGGLV